MTLFCSSSLLINEFKKQSRSRKNHFILISGDICSKEGIRSLIRGSMYDVQLILMLQPPKKNSGQIHSLLSSSITFTICLRLQYLLFWWLVEIWSETFFHYKNSIKEEILLKKLLKRFEKNYSCLVQHSFVSFGMFTCLN